MFAWWTGRDRRWPSEPGEILVRGFNVMQEYFEDPVATREAIDARLAPHG